jgi:hypothetical protein
MTASGRMPASSAGWVPAVLQDRRHRLDDLLPAAVPDGQRETAPGAGNLVDSTGSFSARAAELGSRSIVPDKWTCQPAADPDSSRETTRSITP